MTERVEMKAVHFARFSGGPLKLIWTKAAEQMVTSRSGHRSIRAGPHIYHFGGNISGDEKT